MKRLRLNVLAYIAKMTLSINGKNQNSDISILLDTGCNDRYEYLTENIFGDTVSLISANATPMSPIHVSVRTVDSSDVTGQGVPYVQRVY